MKKEDVSRWYTLDESSILEEQVKGYIANTVEGYLNGVQWDASLYTPMTMDEWRHYVKTNLEMDIKNGMIVNGIEYKHFRFLGAKRFAELVDIYLENYEYVQPYIIR